MKLEIAGDESAIASPGSNGSDPLDDVEVDWLPANEDEAGLVAAHFATPNGIVRVD